jgi:predicted Zn-dependent peptidase
MTALKPEITILDNGFTVITDPIPHAHSVACGCWFRVGTRHENLAQDGIAHMVEHMMFKGTKTRNAQQIIQTIEDAGADINAYTGKEMTAYYLHLLPQDLELGLKMLADILLCSTMPKIEIAREKKVILEEINMYEDQPDRIIFDYFQKTAYPKQSLGSNGLGRKSIIQSMSRADLMTYVENVYGPQNAVLVASGPVQHKKFVSLAKRFFGKNTFNNCFNPVPAKFKAGEFRKDKKCAQTHIVLGFQATSRHDPAYPALRLYSSILGGGMASRLFQEVREKRGLAYSIYSFLDIFQDDGLFGLYVGTSPNNAKELMPVLISELKKSTARLTQNELQRAKTQLKASILMSQDSIIGRADQIARHFIYRNALPNLKKSLAAIDAVRLQDVHQMAERIVSSDPVLSVLGPTKQVWPYQHLKDALQK